MTVDSILHCVWEKPIPLPVERPLPHAFRDWPFRHNVRIRDGKASETCSLKPLRHQFQTPNALAEHTIRVWSQRTLKFSPLALEHYHCLSTLDAQKNLIVLIYECEEIPNATALERRATAEGYPIIVTH
ncbi:hypothetical protein BK670_15620 [Pseudomonas fluorescens]|uniref:Uncharacterized protein n=1 Tax=Pseudomonas fluorescens TaxID=294 RepID=A0A423ME89_PSEFL|nr:hypothetical protein BK670_15620 [Pseudomonas fluorescens]